jgi:hypothetical protein
MGYKVVWREASVLRADAPPSLSRRRRLILIKWQRGKEKIKMRREKRISRRERSMGRNKREKRNVSIENNVITYKFYQINN